MPLHDHGHPWRYTSRSAEDTERLGRSIGSALQGGEVLALYGELGTGKTTLMRGIAAGAGVPPERVTSPTFVLIHEYVGRLRLAHADLYRLATTDELAQTGLSDYLDDRTVVAIEWADRGASELPADRLDIAFAHEASTTRQVTMTAFGSRSKQLLAQIRKTHPQEARDA
jgi:tRNA threonylcarbamoyladenosine biosynthesis protein TsaE